MTYAKELPALNALRAFEATARLGGVGRAGEELHVTHGAVSRQIRQLEAQLGVRLLEKDGRGVKLTDAGQHLSRVTQEALNNIRRACVDVQDKHRDAPFVLGCPGSLLARWFIPRLDRLQRDLPALRLQLSSSEGELDPRRPGVHATLCFSAPPWPADLQCVELAEERIGPVLSARCPRYAALRTAPAAAVLDEPLLHTNSRPQAWPEWIKAQQLTASALTYGQGFEHLYYLLEAAVAGLGVAIAPHVLVADDLAAGRLEAPWGFVPTAARLVLWLPQYPDPRAWALAAWLRAELRC